MILSFRWNIPMYRRFEWLRCNWSRFHGLFDRNVFLHWSKVFNTRLCNLGRNGSNVKKQEKQNKKYDNGKECKTPCIHLSKCVDHEFHCRNKVLRNLIYSIMDILWEPFGTKNGSFWTKNGSFRTKHLYWTKNTHKGFVLYSTRSRNRSRLQCVVFSLS